MCRFLHTPDWLIGLPIGPQISSKGIMQPHPDKGAQDEYDTKNYNLHQAGSHGWHYSIGDNILSPNVLPRSTPSATSLGQLNFFQFGGQTSHEMPVGRQEHGGVASSVLPPKMGEHLVQEAQQDQIYPELHGVPHYGATSPFVLSEEPVYVNAKQYHAILRRRQLRAKAEMENKLTRSRKPYLHESRHLHALRRARGCGGRFINTKKNDTSAGNSSSHEEGSNNLCSEPDSRSYASISSSGAVEPSTSLNDFKRLSSYCTDFFQWKNYHKSFLSK